MTRDWMKFIIILFAILNPIFLFNWLMLNNFNKWAIRFATILLFIQFLLSIYCYFRAKYAHNWLFYEVYTWFNFSFVFLLLGFSGCVSKMPFPYAIYLYIFLYVALHFLWYRPLKKVWDSTIDDNIKSGKFDVTEGNYSIIHRPAVYRFKKEAINKWQAIIVANSSIIIGAAAFYGIMASKRSKNPASAIGIAAVVVSLALTFAVTYAFINLKWVLKWEKENKRKMKTTYL